jgi:hypothetical protein
VSALTTSSDGVFFTLWNASLKSAACTNYPALFNPAWRTLSVSTDERSDLREFVRVLDNAADAGLLLTAAGFPAMLPLSPGIAAIKLLSWGAGLALDHAGANHGTAPAPAGGD